MMPTPAIESESKRPSNNGGARPGSGAPKGNGNARKHGLNTLRTALTTLGSRALDGRFVAELCAQEVAA
jgi:hypothetical protein